MKRDGSEFGFHPNPRVGIQEMESKSWNPRVGIQELESKRWNPESGIQWWESEIEGREIRNPMIGIRIQGINPKSKHRNSKFKESKPSPGKRIRNPRIGIRILTNERRKPNMEIRIWNSIMDPKSKEEKLCPRKRIRNPGLGIRIPKRKRRIPREGIRNPGIRVGTFAPRSHYDRFACHDIFVCL